MASLTSDAELRAKDAEDLENFQGFSLLGVKKEVETLLSMIGKVREIFSTYTVHDISHIDAILASLDWLIPDDTKDRMSQTDWLFIVLAVYFHDLGMVVTAEEFDHRDENEGYRKFVEKIENDTENKDYVSRIQALKGGEYDRFIFQEFIRTEHARRIREWISGEPSFGWNPAVKPIAETIDTILKDLPPRFRTQLGVIAESHHLDDLEDSNKYPLCQRFGPTDQHAANVQYAAIILRTADLLHVTKDRTPSISYKLLSISDPLGIDEWKKQQGIISVGLRSRRFIPEDKETHVVQIDADFEEERPFFALTEYVTYADAQIRQSKTWADASEETVDGQGYHYPWINVTGRILVEGNEPVPMSFELDRGRLLDLLVGHTIYNDATVAVREVIQNSIDAVRYQFYREQKRIQAPSLGSVRVLWDEPSRTLEILDDGVGMSLQTIQGHLMKVGSSYYDTPKFKAENVEFSPISRFGIGVLTYFMISDDIEIITCHGETAHRIRMSSVQADYLLKKLPMGDPELEGFSGHGTKVRLKIRPSVDLALLDIGEILDYWVILPGCEVSYEIVGSKKRSIGFDSVQAALKYWSGRHLDDSQTKNIICNVETAEDESGKFELGYLCRQSFGPEFRFVGVNHRKISKQVELPPAVCIEGIRVSNRLPGFIPVDRSGIFSLLAVKGSRTFTTTVSRSDLEDDTEYRRVGELCANLLLRHVREEVARISKQEGSPFSLASSAAGVLYEQLRGSVGNSLHSVLTREFETVKRYVLENVDSDGQYERKLISSKELKTHEYFWTHESRFADYLGVISRDFGKEIGIHEFLAAVAPHLLENHVSPILADYRFHSDELASSFSVDEIKFSSSDNTLVSRWVQEDRRWPVDIDFLDDFERMQQISIKLQSKEIMEFYEWVYDSVRRQTIAHSSKKTVFIADFHGESTDVRWVTLSGQIVLNKDSDEAAFLNQLSSLVASLSDIQKNALEMDILSVAFFMFIQLGYLSAPSAGGAYVRDSTRTQERDYRRMAQGIWRPIIKYFDDGDETEGDLENMFLDHDGWFDPRSYWYSWGREGD